jgi:hypothetical protein
MKIDIELSKLACLMILAIASCTSIIFGIQGFIYKDSVLRHTQYYKMECVASILMGIIIFIGFLVTIYKP